MTLRTGRVYRGELVLPFFVSQGMAHDRLEAAGFADVMIYKAGGKLCAQGRWVGESREVEIPPQLRNVEELP